MAEVSSKRDRGFIDTKREVLWIEWQTLCRHYTEDKLIIGEWFYDIIEKYSEPARYIIFSDSVPQSVPQSIVSQTDPPPPNFYRKYHNLDHIYQMILNFKHFYQQLTYPRTVLFAIFFHDYIYNPKVR